MKNITKVNEFFTLYRDTFVAIFCFYLCWLKLTSCHMEAAIIPIQLISRIPGWICGSWLNPSNVFNLTSALWTSHIEGSRETRRLTIKLGLDRGNCSPGVIRARWSASSNPPSFLLCCSKTKLTVCARLPLIPCFLRWSGGWLSQMFSFKRRTFSCD